MKFKVNKYQNYLGFELIKNTENNFKITGTLKLPKLTHQLPFSMTTYISIILDILSIVVFFRQNSANLGKKEHILYKLILKIFIHLIDF